MNKNVGNIERTVRIVAGAVIIGLEVTGNFPYSPWGWLGAVPLFTGLIGWCPPYAIFGISTCKTKA